ncbi:MAG: ferric reductase-like transmembrane domain-containing protein [Rhodocyclales bacterium]|nr:ferric reductase-like transmembrane domain-containing protein [Rhodocyclales bacterium]
MPTLLSAFIAIVILAWSWGVGAATPLPASLPWAIYQHSLYLSGLLAIALMSLTMMLATRPAWLERPLGGLDRIYRTHKWAGILAVSLAGVHWLIEMGDDVVKSLVGRTGRPAEEHSAGLLKAMRHAAEEVGEWAIYVVIAMIAITLWRRFPYKFWRNLHRAMPALYLLLVFHAAWLAPVGWWNQPVGPLLGLLLMGGTIAAGLSLSGLIGRSRSNAGTVVAIRNPSPDVTEVVCELGADWRGHRAGQFAFVTFDRHEGHHPFTIASADQGDGRVTFLIKALGDYTRDLTRHLAPGQAVSVEGPYGRFDFTRSRAGARQIWVAGGIGVTPFIAWLESLLGQPDRAPEAVLHYCTRNADTDAAVARLQVLSAELPSIRLHVHDDSKGQRLTAARLDRRQEQGRHTDIWFCGPAGLGSALRASLRNSRHGRFRFHQEAFEMR